MIRRLSVSMKISLLLIGFLLFSCDSPPRKQLTDEQVVKLKQEIAKLHKQAKVQKKLKADLKECNRSAKFEHRMCDNSVTMAMGLLDKAEASCDCKAPLRIVFIGDSITTGSYPKILKSMLGTRAEIKVYAKKNATLAYMRDLLAQSAEDGDEFHPTHIIMYGGINDCGRLSSSQIVLMLEELRQAASLQVGLENVYTVEIFGNQTCADEVNPKLWGYKINTEHFRGPILRGGTFHKQYFRKDLIHLTVKGHRKLAQLIYEQVDWTNF